MSVSDLRMVELYTQFREVRRSLSELPLANYWDSDAGGRGLRLPHTEAAIDRRRELANAINGYWRELRSAQAWHEVYLPLDAEERVEVLLDHLWSHAAACVDLPYILRGRFIEAVCVLSATVGSSLGRQHSETPEHFSMKEAKRLADSWTSWRALASELSNLGGKEFTAAVGNLRNDRHHGAPDGIELGMRLHAKVSQSEGRNRVSIFIRQPVALAAILAAAEAEYHRSLRCLSAFDALVAEQDSAVTGRFSQKKFSCDSA